MKKKGSDALARPSSSRLPREELGHAKLSLVRPQLLEPRALLPRELLQRLRARALLRVAHIVPVPQKKKEILLKKMCAAKGDPIEKCAR